MGGIRTGADTAAAGADGFELAWVDDGVEVRRPLVEASAVAFENAAPVRKFPSYRGQRHFPGLYWSASTGRHVGFESWLERDHAMLLDFDPQVKAFASQPFWLWWLDEATGRSRSHAPDFFARSVDGTGLVVDCRPAERVDEQAASAFAATRRACAAIGWAYRQVGVLDPVRAGNLRWLAGYRHRRCLGSPGLAEAVAAAFAVPAPLASAASTVGDVIEVLPVLFHLLWSGVLAADWSRPLSDFTLVERRVGR